MPRGVSRYDEAQLQGRLWTPDLVRPALWLDWADVSTISLATGISEVRDKSGNARHFTQSVSASQPAYRLDGINGLGSMSFDGTAKALQRAPESWAFQYPITSFIVFRAAAFTNAYNSLFEFFTSAGPTTAGWSDLIKSNGKSAIYSTNTAGGQPNYDGTGAFTYLPNRTYIFTGVYQNNAMIGLQNGKPDGSNTGTYTLRTNLGTSPLYIGSSPMFSRYTNWMIGEVIITNGAELSVDNRMKVLGHLAWKWGNAPDLVTTNPFLNRPPLIGD